MMIHPVRMTGLIIGVSQTFDYFKRIQERIVSFVVSHSQIRKERLTELMLETGELTKDVGSILVGEQAVREGLIDEAGGIQDAFRKLHELMKAEMRLSFVWFLAIMGACEPGWVTLASDECTREKERYDGSFNRIRCRQAYGNILRN